MSNHRSDLKGRRLASLCALSAAGVAAAGGEEAEAGIVFTTVNENIGFAPGDLPLDHFPVPGGRFAIGTTTFLGFSRSLFMVGSTVNANFRVKSQVFGGYGFARPLNAGLRFGTAPGGVADFAFLEFATPGGGNVGPGLFTDKYYAFSFVNAGVTDYGWVLGSLTNISYNNLSYHITSYAYENTGIQIATGQTTLTSVPEPATLSMSLLGGALVAGASGVRRWKKAKAEANAAVA